MTITIQPGPIIAKWGPRGQCFYSEYLTPRAARSIACDLLKEADLAERDAERVELGVIPVFTSRRKWHVSPDPVPNGSRSPFEHERDLAPCDVDMDH